MYSYVGSWLQLSGWFVQSVRRFEDGRQSNSSLRHWLLEHARPKSDMNLALRSEIHWSFSKPATPDCPCNDVCIISEALEHHANVLSLFFPGEGGGIHE